MSKKIKDVKQAIERSMSTAEHRRKIIGMVAELNDERSLKVLYDLTYAFYLDKGEPSASLSKAESLEKHIYWCLPRICNPKYLEFIYGFVYRLFLKPDSDKGCDAP